MLTGIYMFLLFGLPVVGIIVNTVIEIETYKANQDMYDNKCTCKGRIKCNRNDCTYYGIFGCPFGYVYMTEAERKELKKKIAELDC